MRGVSEILVAHINLWPGWGLYWKTCLYLLSQDRILSSGVCHIGQHMSQFITWRIWPHGNQCMVHHMGCTKNIDLMKAQYIYGVDQPKVRQKLKPCFWYCDTVHMSWKMCQGNKVKDTSVKTMFLLLFWYLHVYKADNIFQWCLPCLQCKRFNVEQHLTLSPVSYGGPSFA